MKKILRYSVPCVMVCAIALASCKDFLDAMPSGKRTEEEAYGDLKSAALVVNGLYSLNIKAMRGKDYQVTFLGTDETRVSLNQYMGGGWDGIFGAWDDYGPMLNGNASSQTGNTWNNYWKIVSEANKVVGAMRGSEDAAAKQLVAESRFMRGLNMFRLAVLWGDIPITDPVFATTNGYSRQPQDVVWKFIIDDFDYAAKVLPETQSDAMRPTKYAALAMLGKSLMQTGEETGLRDFAAADACFTQIIGSGKFDLVPNYDDLWNNAPFKYPDIPESTTVPGDKTPDFMTNGKSESLFTVQFRRPGSDDSYISCWSWETGSWEAEVWFQGEDSWLAGYQSIMPNTFMYEDDNTVAETFRDYEYPDPDTGPQWVDRGVGVWETGDRRFDASIRYEWQYYTNIFKEQPTMSYGVNNLDGFRRPKDQWTSSPYQWIVINERKGQLANNMRQSLNPIIKKFEDARCDRSAGLGISMFRTHKAFALIRYADILLLHAECLSETGQLPQAIDVVQNQVRKRAWGAGTPPAWNPGSKDEFRKMVMDERMRELCFEGWRRADLIRTGLFVELVKARNDWTKLNPGNINETKQHWPIPYSELVENADSWGWVQNPGYTE